jgi:hypothetical protein
VIMQCVSRHKAKNLDISLYAEYRCESCVLMSSPVSTYWIDCSDYREAIGGNRTLHWRLRPDQHPRKFTNISSKCFYPGGFNVNHWSSSNLGPVEARSSPIRGLGLDEKTYIRKDSCYFAHRCDGTSDKRYMLHNHVLPKNGWNALFLPWCCEG